MQKVKGFTILEIVVALGIFAIGILALTPIYTMGLEMSKRHSKKIEALFILKNIVEKEKAKGFSKSDTGLPRTPVPNSEKMPNSRLKNVYKEIKIISRNDAEKWFKKHIIVSYDYTIAGITKTKKVEAYILIVN